MSRTGAVPVATHKLLGNGRLRLYTRAGEVGTALRRTGSNSAGNAMVHEHVCCESLIYVYVCAVYRRESRRLAGGDWREVLILKILCTVARSCDTACACACCVGTSPPCGPDLTAQLGLTSHTIDTTLRSKTNYSGNMHMPCTCMCSMHVYWAVSVRGHRPPVPRVWRGWSRPRRAARCAATPTAPGPWGRPA